MEERKKEIRENQLQTAKHECQIFRMIRKALQSAYIGVA